MTRIREQPVNWAAIYEGAQTHLWEQQPHEFSVAAAGLVGTGNVTDLGCGEGYDSIFFAKNGFTVIAVDTSKAVIDKLRYLASEKNYKIDPLIGDVRTIKISNPQSVVVSYGTLHFLGHDFEQRIKHFQTMTKSGGIHALYVFGNSGDFYDIAKHKFWFPSVDELQDLYKDWDIRRLEEKTIEMLIRGDNGEILHNSLIKILAQKNYIPDAPASDPIA